MLLIHAAAIRQKFDEFQELAKSGKNVHENWENILNFGFTHEIILAFIVGKATIRNQLCMLAGGYALKKSWMFPEYWLLKEFQF